MVVVRRVVVVVTTSLAAKAFTPNSRATRTRCTKEEAPSKESSMAGKASTSLEQRHVTEDYAAGAVPSTVL